MPLRAKGLAPVTFFSFQDIITCVTGVMILVTLLMSTQINTKEETARSNDQGQIQEMETELSRVLKEMTDFRAAIVAIEQGRANSQTLPDVAMLRSDIERILENIAELTAAAKATKIAAPTTTTENLDKLGLPTRVIAQLQEDVRKLREELARKTQARDLIARTVHDAARPPDPNNVEVWVVEGGGPRKPLVAVVSRDGVTLQRFGQPEEHKLAGPLSSDKFRAALETYGAANFYICFYIKPSGVGNYRRLKAVARTAGFDIGYDVLDENTQLRFLAPHS